MAAGPHDGFPHHPAQASQGQSQERGGQRESGDERGSPTRKEKGFYCPKRTSTSKEGGRSCGTIGRAPLTRSQAQPLRVLALLTRSQPRRVHSPRDLQPQESSPRLPHCLQSSGQGRPSGGALSQVTLGTFLLLGLRSLQGTSKWP